MLKLFKEKKEAIKQAVKDERRKITAEHDVEISALISDHKKRVRAMALECENRIDADLKKQAKEYDEEIKSLNETIIELMRQSDNARQAWRHINHFAAILMEYAENEHTEEEIEHKRLTQRYQRAAARKSEIEKLLIAVKGQEKTIKKLLQGG